MIILCHFWGPLHVVSVVLQVILTEVCNHHCTISELITCHLIAGLYMPNIEHKRLLEKKYHTNLTMWFLWSPVQKKLTYNNNISKTKKFNFQERNSTMAMYPKKQKERVYNFTSSFMVRRKKKHVFFRVSLPLIENSLL